MNGLEILSPYIQSCIPGRMRIRHPLLKGDSGNGAAEYLRSVDGVISAEVNPRTGSLLLFWDPEKLDIETLAPAAAMLAGTAADALQKDTLACCADSVCGVLKAVNPLSAGKKVNRSVNRAMTAAYAVSMLSLIPAAGLRSLKFHAYAGGAFTVFLLWHMIRYRKTVI